MGAQTQAAKEQKAKEEREAQLKAFSGQSRDINKSARNVEREIQKLQLQEQKLLQEITKHAKAGRHGPAKIMAKQVAQLRKQQEQFYGMSAQLKGTSAQL